MDKYAKLLETLKRALVSHTVPILAAEVTAVNGESCKVKIGELELTDVRVKATINGAGNKILVLPKVGSKVLIGSLTGDLKDLTLLKIDEIEQMQYVQDGLEITVDSTDGKVAVKNNSISLKDLFQQLTDLLLQFQVYTPAGPSGTALPPTVMSIKKFETDFKMLLK